MKLGTIHDKTCYYSNTVALSSFHGVISNFGLFLQVLPIRFTLVSARPPRLNARRHSQLLFCAESTVNIRAPVRQDAVSRMLLTVHKPWRTPTDRNGRALRCRLKYRYIQFFPASTKKINSRGLNN